MRVKRIMGYVFIAVSFLLLFAVVGLVPFILNIFFRLGKAFTGALDSFEIWRAIGGLIGVILHLTIMITLFSYGRRWIKGKANSTEKHEGTESNN